MRNIIDAIVELVNKKAYTLNGYTSKSSNSANAMGDAFEEYIKDLFAGSIGVTDPSLRLQLHNNIFSWKGNNTNPPDAMIKGGDAIEAKKLESPNSDIPLNSSYPKAKLYADSSMISKYCKECEQWVVKDMIYTIGIIKKHTDIIESMTFIYGIDYCADKDVYEKVRSNVKNGVENTEGLEFEDTNELGRINKVDPLGITYLRIRGMWGIKNPFVHFEQYYKRDPNKSFNFMAIINVEKIKELGNFENLESLANTIPELNISDIKISNPNNPAIIVDAKLITFSIK